jgi:hypothetical protein
MKDEYNAIIDDLVHVKKDRINAYKKEQSFSLQHFNVSNETMKKIKPVHQDIKKFKNALKQISFTNIDENNNGFQSLSIIRNSIPIIRQTLKSNDFKKSWNEIELYIFLRIIKYDDEVPNDIKHTTTNYIIKNINQIKEVLHQSIDEMKYFITEKVELKGSGCKFVKVLSVKTRIGKYNPKK